MVPKPQKIRGGGSNDILFFLSIKGEKLLSFLSFFSFFQEGEGDHLKTKIDV